MRTKPTLHDIICLHLADIDDWTPSFLLSKLTTNYGWIGSSGERRARELAEGLTHEYKGVIYTIERRQNGKYAEYRVLSKLKPRWVYVEKVNSDGETVRVPTLVAVVRGAGLSCQNDE